MRTLCILRKALLAIVALRAGAALAVPPPAPLPLATSTVVSDAAAAPSPTTPVRRAPDPDPAPWSFPVPVLTGISFKLPIPKVAFTRIDTTYTGDATPTTTPTGRPFGMRPGHGLGGLGRGRHGGHAGYGEWGGLGGLGGIGGGFGGFDGGLGGGGLDIWPLHDMPEPALPPHRRPEDVAQDRAGDLALPPLPVVPGRIPKSQYGFTGHDGRDGRDGHGRQRHLRRWRRLPLLDDEWTEWYERPYGRPATDAYDDFDDDDDVDMGPPPLWMDPTPVVQESENTTRTEQAKTTFTRTAKFTGTGVKTLKKIWGKVKTGEAFGVWGRPGDGGKEKRDGEQEAEKGTI